MYTARKAAAHRQRRLILDDDGDLVYDKRTQDGPESFCQLRLKDCLEASVDSIAWCVIWGITQGSPGSVRYWQTQMRDIPFQPNMPDPTPVIIEFCQQHKIEIFGSIRMNDCHDAYGMPFDKLVYPLKVEYPGILIGDGSQRGAVESGLEAAMWSGLDFKDRVREDRLWWIKHTATAYDLDGVDLNFFRMPWLFKIGQESTHLMTDLIRQARQCINGIS